MRSEEARARCTLRLITVLVALSAAALLAATTAGASGAATVKVVRSLETVQPGATPTGLPIDNPPNGTPIAHLRAARNEFESFQVVVRNDEAAALEGLEVETDGPLEDAAGATIPESDVTVYGERYYTVYTPSDQEGWEQYEVPYEHVAAEEFNTTGWECTEATVGPTYPLPCEYPDALVPERDVFYGETREAFPNGVPAHQNRVAWIDVLVPSGTPTGDYSGDVTVTARGLSKVVDIDLEVFDFEVPSTPTLKGGWDMSTAKPCVAQGGCSSSEEGFALDSLYDRAALEDRIGITHPSFNDPTGNPDTPGSNAALFQRFVEPLIDGTATPGANDPSAPRLEGAEIEDIFLNQSLREEKTQAQLAQAVEAWKSEAQNGGFLGKVHFYCDEMAENLMRWSTYCNVPYEEISASWHGLKTVFTGDIKALEFATREHLAVAASIDTLIPLVDQMHPRNGPSQRSLYDAFLNTAGNSLWLYQSCDSLGCSGGRNPPRDYSAGPWWDGWPSLGIDQPASEARAMDWQAFNYKAGGQFYYDVVSQLQNAWNTCSAKSNACLYYEGGNGDGTLFYPGTKTAIGGRRDIPVESIRMKRYRDGEEDYELLHYLATELGKERQVREIAGGPYAPTAETGLFTRMNESNVSDAELETARDELIGMLPESTDHAPVWEAIGDKEVAPGEPLAFIVGATDQDGDALSYSVAGLPAGASFDPISRRFEWTPGLAAVGTHSGIRFTVSDGQASDVEEISITVDGSGGTCGGKAVTTAGGPEADHLVGTPGPDVISGNGGEDTIDGGGGDDTICGGDGYDTIEGGPGDDTLDGGPGEDAVEYGRTTGGGVVVDLRKERDQATGAAGTDQLSGFSEVYGSPGDDTLIGSDSNQAGPKGWSEYLAGNGGSDTILGGGGPDLLSGGEGADTIEGGPGEDQIQGGAGADRIEGRDGTFDMVSCGEDVDSVTADAIDEVDSDCEGVDRGAPAVGPPAPESTSSPAPETPPSSTSPATPTGQSPPPQLPDIAFVHTPKHRLKVRSLPARVALSFASTTTGAHFSCRLDARYFSHCASPFVAWVGGGGHLFTVTATDEAGADPVPATWAFTIKRQRSSARPGRHPDRASRREDRAACPSTTSTTVRSWATSRPGTPGSIPKGFRKPQKPPPRQWSPAVRRVSSHFPLVLCARAGR